MEFNIGPRMVKTGLAVALTLLITDLLDLDLEIVAAIAAVLAMQPSIMRSYAYIKEVVISNSVGIIFALAGYFLLGNHPLSVGAVVIISIAINIKIGLNKTVSLTVLTIITMMLGGSGGISYLYIIERVSLVAIGVLAAFIINALVMPPNHKKILFSMIKKASEQTNFLLRVISNKTMSVPQMRVEDKEAEKLINEAKSYYEIISDERNRLFIRKRINFFRNIIIYKHMIQVLCKKHTLIRELEKNFNEIEMMPSNKSQLIKKLILEINAYSENIILLYEGKIVLDKDLQKETKAAMQVTINNLIDELQGAEFAKWAIVFPIANSIIELFFELNKLERFVRFREGKEN
ncbi:FUSC family protein [Ornithinibacillus halotolerans]|uniref:Membrane protein n=1 Tax=Ornithinibacillus halotolerans TaxID=1274357 RepID=A0A916WAV5_9BACI|nr:aromatic acid exporter family protein [Ornithinibacillus halotolerans]GGA81125.1 membrane protein [Ornithinibacillus halotolerans]